MLDRDDNDPKRLWASVVAAVAGLPVGAAGQPAARPVGLAAWRPTGVPRRARPTPCRRCPGRSGLILDDVHELVDPDALHGVQIFTLRNRPPGSSSSCPAGSTRRCRLPRLRLAGRLWELRAARLRFSPAEAAHPARAVGTTTHPRAGRGAAPADRRLGRRPAAGRARAVAETADREAFLDQFSGDDRSVADYLVGEILSGLPEDMQEFLRVISISDPLPSGLAAAAVRPGGRRQRARPARAPDLAGRPPPDGAREAYRVQELLRTYLLADLQRQGPPRAAELHATAARWWADQDQPIPALDHAAAQPQPRAAVGPAAPLRRAADPHRRPRAAAPRAGQRGRPGHRVRSLAGPDLAP